MTIEAIIDPQELPKIQSVVEGLHLGNGPLLPSRAQNFVEITPGAVSTGDQKTIAFVRSSVAPPFGGACVYSGTIYSSLGPNGIYCLITTGFADPNRQTNNRVGYIGNHSSP